MSRCIFCGYCELACPFDAITLGHDYELAEMSRDAMVYTKGMLLEPAPEARRTPVAPTDPFDVVDQGRRGQTRIGRRGVPSLRAARRAPE